MVQSLKSQTATNYFRHTYNFAGDRLVIICTLRFINWQLVQLIETKLNFCLKSCGL